MARRRDYKPGGVRHPGTHRTAGKSWATVDGFTNFVAKLGGGQDQLTKGRYLKGNNLTRQRQTLESMYRTSWVVGRMVDVVAEDMVRGGLDIQSDLDPGDVDKLLRYMRRMGVPSRLSEAIKWGRLYGGALAVILIDGDELSEPLRVDEIKKDSFRGLYVLDRHQVTPSTEIIRDLGPMLGYPEYYTVNDGGGLQGQRLHHTRVIRFIGVELPIQERMTEQYWGASVVERVHDRILALDSATYGSANMILKSYLRVIGINKFRDVLAAGGRAEQALYKMFEMIRQMQTNEGLTLLDKEDSFSTHNWTFAGVYDALQAFSEQLSGGSGVPLVRLLGQSPKGFSTGDTDLRNYYDTIATQQDDDLRPAYETLLPVLSRSLWGKPLPEGAHFEFTGLWQPSETDKAAIFTSDAQGVAALFASGLIDEAQAKTELRDAGRVTGRFTGITDEDIKAAATSLQAPPPEAEPETAEPKAGPEPKPEEALEPSA